jgi:hypothetical protein
LRNCWQATGILALGAGGLAAKRALADSALPWGTYPSDLADLAVPQALQAKQVLEVHIAGGMSAWENVYAVPSTSYGKGTGKFLYTFLDGSGGILNRLAACGDNTAAITLPYAQDELGNTVCLGPLARPLWQRPDIVSRMRMVIASHDLIPHDPALGLADTGRGPGNASAASLGTFISRHAMAAGIAGSLPTSQVVYSFNSVAGQNNWLGSTIGLNPPAARPFRLASQGSYPASLQLLEGPNGLDAAFAGVGDHLATSYQQRLVFPGGVDTARSGTWTEYVGARQQYDQLASIKTALPPALFTELPVALCGESPQFDASKINLALAAKLIAAKQGVRYVYVLDSSLPTSDVSSSAFDWHYNFAARAAPAMPYFWDRLMGAIAKPGEVAEGKINLDDTLVVVSTEFGREPGQTPGTAGRNHWPYAYPLLFFGGPVGKSQAGILGAIGPDAEPISSVSPATQRAAILVALGIYPFESGAFTWQDIPGMQNEVEALTFLRDKVLGVTV